MNVLKRSDGVVALLTTIMISLLLLVITVGMISLETLQLRKSEDSEQSLRAYYAAEAGVEDAVSKVLNGDISKDKPQDCSNAASRKTDYDPGGLAGWTCQSVIFSGKPAGELKNPDEAQTIDPGKTNPFYAHVLLEWSDLPTVLGMSYSVGPAFPSDAAYRAMYAVPPIELAIVDYPDGGFKASDVGSPPAGNVHLQNAVIVPGGGSPGNITFDVNGTFMRHGPFQANCVAGRMPYNCRALISGFVNAKDYLFRIRSRYMGTKYRMTFTNPGNVQVDVADGTALIDVTAKAGDATRRVISKLQMNGAASGLNYVIYSDTDICKNFQVFSNTAQPAPGTGC